MKDVKYIRSAALYECRKLPPKTNASCGVYYTEISRENRAEENTQHTTA
jgi:hypothetical protein